MLAGTEFTIQRLLTEPDNDSDSDPPIDMSGRAHHNFKRRLHGVQKALTTRAVSDVRVTTSLDRIRGFEADVDAVNSRLQDQGREIEDLKTELQEVVVSVDKVRGVLAGIATALSLPGNADEEEVLRQVRALKGPVTESDAGVGSHRRRKK